MTRAKIFAWLAINPAGGTADEIARALGCRTFDVRAELRALADLGLVQKASHGATPQTQQFTYSAMEAGRDGRGTGQHGALAALSGSARPSQCDRLLTLLADGTCWSSHDLHRQVFCVLHSRIAELRRKLAPLGYTIEHTGGGAGTDVHFYKLVPLNSSSAAGGDRISADGELSGTSNTHHQREPLLLGLIGDDSTAAGAAQLSSLEAA